MPPKGTALPSADSREQFTNWVTASVRTVGCAAGAMPSATRMRRLNRDEYTATVQSLLDIHMEDSSTVAPPRVAESPASIECRLERIVEVGSAYVVFGAVSAITVRDDVLVDGHPAMGHLRPVSRLGGDEWGRPPEVFHLTRPTKPDDVL